MKIKLPFAEIETSKECPCSNYDEYEIKIKCIKAKLHGTYLLIIASIICVWLFSLLTYDHENFVGQMSFASTIASIILSVLAIIMSITGEGKTEHIKDQLEASAKEIKKSQETVNDINKTIKSNLQKVSEGMDSINKKIDSLPDATAQKVSEYALRNDDIDSDSQEANNMEI